MGWVRIDDSFSDHPKALQARGLPLTLWMEGLCYANKHLTDGELKRFVVASMRLVPNPLKHAETLVAVGLWDRTDDGFRIHDYAEFYESADEVKRRRALDSARKRRGIQPDTERNPPQILRAGAAAGAGLGVVQDLVQVQDQDLVPATALPQSVASTSTANAPTDGADLVARAIKANTSASEELAETAACFTRMFEELHATHQYGAPYYPRWARDWQHCLDAASRYPDREHLRKLIALYMQATGRQFDGKPKSPGRFLDAAPMLDARLRAAGEVA